MQAKIKKSDFVTYWCYHEVVKARVVRAHRDGSLLVEPYFFLDVNGDAKGGFIGGRVQVPAKRAALYRGAPDVCAEAS